jgi:hypothetical protein
MAHNKVKPKSPELLAQSIEGRCNAKLRKKDKLCRNPSGFRTDHHGSGRCYLHGGGRGTGRPPTHGRYMRYSTLNINSRLKSLIEQHAQDPDPLNLEAEVVLLRALVQDFVERYEGYIDGLARLKATTDPAIQILFSKGELDSDQMIKGFQQLRISLQQKPSQILDISVISTLVDRLGHMVERVHKMKSAQSLTPDRVKSMFDGMGLIVMKYCTPEIAEKIRVAWMAMQF